MNAAGQPTSAGEPAQIRFNVPMVQGNELQYVAESIRSGHMSSGGAFASRAAELLRSEAGAEEVLLDDELLSLDEELLELVDADSLAVLPLRESVR